MDSVKLFELTLTSNMFDNQLRSEPPAHSTKFANHQKPATAPASHGNVPDSSDDPLAIAAVGPGLSRVSLSFSTIKFPHTGQVLVSIPNSTMKLQNSTHDAHTTEEDCDRASCPSPVAGYAWHLFLFQTTNRRSSAEPEKKSSCFVAPTSVEAHKSSAGSTDLNSLAPVNQFKHATLVKQNRIELCSPYGPSGKGSKGRALSRSSKSLPSISGCPFRTDADILHLQRWHSTKLLSDRDTYSITSVPPVPVSASSGEVPIYVDEPPVTADTGNPGVPRVSNVFHFSSNTLVHSVPIVSGRSHSLSNPAAGCLRHPTHR